MADESLREIQLNGKQLVFVFMSATVVAVVIFLSGVMVGRTVPQGEPVALAASLDDTPGLMTETVPPPSMAPSDGPVAANEVITYPSYLESAVPPEETLPVETVVEAPLEPPVIAEPAASAAAALEPAPSGQAAAAGLQEPPGNGFVVQVAALNRRPEAEAIARDLAAKGYPSFVTTPGSDAPLVFRVRVGKYPDRREAEAIAGRLEREEQFKPWITR